MKRSEPLPADVWRRKEEKGGPGVDTGKERQFKLEGRALAM